MTHNAEIDAPFAWESCGFQWAWEGDETDHIHRCRHDSGHPGRHTCVGHKCWSWQLRNDTREKAQSVRPTRVTPPEVTT